MNITDRSNHVEYLATAAQTTFTFNFLLLSPLDLVVKVNGVAATYAASPVGAMQFNVAIVAGVEGGSITFGAGCTLLDAVNLQRTSIISRSGAQSTSGPLNVNALNDSIDRAVVVGQDNRELANRAVQVVVGEATLVMPLITARPSKLLGFDSLGGFALYSMPTVTLGTVTSGAAAVNQRGSASNPIFDFVLQPGTNGTAGTLAVGTVSTGAAGTSVIITNVGTATAAILNITIPKGVDGGGSGSVTSLTITAANGVSGTVLNSTTTPAITIVLGAITPTSVAASGTISGSNLSGSSSGTNTGDQFTAIATARFLGRTTAAVGAAEILTGTQATAMLDAAVASGASGLLTGADKTKLDGIAAGATANPFALAFFFQGKQLVTVEVLGGLIAPFATTFVQGNCVAKGLVAATASTTFTIKKNGTAVGTVVFAGAATVGTTTLTTATCAIGDYFTLHGPAGSDATLSDVAIMLR